MRIALLSDIHGHITGLQAVLSRLKRDEGVDAIYALGDYVGGGPGLDEVVELLLTHQVRMIRGNWDELFLGWDQQLARIPPAHHEAFLKTAEWLMSRLSREAQQVLAALPVSETLQVSPTHQVLLCHATPQDPWARVCRADTPTAALRTAYGIYDVQVIAYGHYHSQHVLQVDNKLLVNVASVGLGWKGLSALTVLEATTDAIRVQQYQVPYDTDAHDRLVEERKMPADPAIWYWE